MHWFGSSCLLSSRPGAFSSLRLSRAAGSGWLSQRERARCRFRWTMAILCRLRMTLVTLTFAALGL